MIKVRFSWFVPPTYHAWVPWFNTILVNAKFGQIDQISLAHELRHVEQWEENGIIFPILYLIQAIKAKFSRDDIAFEVEAHEAEHSEYYLNWAKEVLIANGIY